MNDKNIDFICIEIIEEDNLISKIEPFEIDENNYNIDFELEKYDKRGIAIASLGGKVFQKYLKVKFIVQKILMKNLYIIVIQKKDFQVGQ